MVKSTFPTWLVAVPSDINHDVLYRRFRAECKSSGKSLMVWTVNDPDHMMEVCLVE